MAQILAIAYNTGTQIKGTLQYGVLAVSNSNRDYSNNYGGVTWWATPDLSQRYVICYPDPSGTHPTPFEGVFANLGFCKVASLSGVTLKGKSGNCPLSQFL